MSATSPAQALADATSAIVFGQDVPDTLQSLLHDCAQLICADTIGLMATSGSHDLELLAATSHQAAELELFQRQHSVGPCLDVVRSGGIVTATSADEITARWPLVGGTIVDAGFAAVLAFPLRWHGHVFGCLNVFLADPSGADGEATLLGQTFADIATLVILRSSDDLSASQLAARLQRMAHARAVIEQAKGALAHRHHVDMPEAYERLRQEASATGQTLTETAAAILRQGNPGPVDRPGR